MESAFDPAIPDENKSPQLQGLLVSMIVLTTITTAARIIVKLITRTRFTVDNYFIILATVIGIVGSCLDYKGTAAGFGRHSQYLSPGDIQTALKYTQIAVGFANFQIWATKVSICFFLLNIVQRIHRYRYFRWGVWALMTVTSICYFTIIVLWGLQARPFPALWGEVEGVVEPRKFLLRALYTGFSINALTTLVYALSPLYFLWGVQIQLKKKLTMIALTGAGLLLTATNILNIVYAHDSLDMRDPTWSLINEFICVVVSRNFSVVVANLPSLWTLSHELWERYHTYVSQKSRSNNSESRNTTARMSGKADHISKGYRSMSFGEHDELTTIVSTTVTSDRSGQSLEAGRLESELSSLNTDMLRQSPLRYDDEGIPVRRGGSPSDISLTRLPEAMGERIIVVQTEFTLDEEDRGSSVHPPRRCR